MTFSAEQLLLLLILKVKFSDNTVVLFEYDFKLQAFSEVKDLNTFYHHCKLCCFD